jgi:hypothetical protein
MNVEKVSNSENGDVKLFKVENVYRRILFSSARTL